VGFHYFVSHHLSVVPPAKFAAIEARWHDAQPAAEALIGIPDLATESNKYALSIPVLGSLIATMLFTLHIPAGESRWPCSGYHSSLSASCRARCDLFSGIR
jgi:cytochrome bd-type quinol oxidase subunit 1